MDEYETYLAYKYRRQACFILPLTIFVAVMYTAEWLHKRVAEDYPLVEGKAIEQEKFYRFGVLPLHRIKIRILETDTIVFAETNSSGLEASANGVKFHYTGDPDYEVFIEGEEEPLPVLLFCWGVSIVIVVFIIIPIHRPHWRISKLAVKIGLAPDEKKNLDPQLYH